MTWIMSWQSSLTTLLRKLAVGFRASVLEREETGGPLAASGQRVSLGKTATEATLVTKADPVSEVHLV